MSNQSDLLTSLFNSESSTTRIIVVILFKNSLEKGSDFAAEVIKNHIVVYGRDKFREIENES